MDHREGADKTGDVRLDFDRRVRLEFHGSKISSNGGLLLFRELDCVFRGIRLKSAWSSLPVPFWRFQGVKTCFVWLRPDKHGRRSWLNNEKILTYDFTLIVWTPPYGFTMSHTGVC